MSRSPLDTAGPNAELRVEKSIHPPTLSQGNGRSRLNPEPRAGLLSGSLQAEAGGVGGSWFGILAKLTGWVWSSPVAPLVSVIPSLPSSAQRLRPCSRDLSRPRNVWWLRVSGQRCRLRRERQTPSARDPFPFRPPICALREPRFPVVSGEATSDVFLELALRAGRGQLASLTAGCELQ